MPDILLYLIGYFKSLTNFKVQISDLSISTVTFPSADSLTALKCSSLLFSVPRQKRQKVNKTQKTWSKTAVNGVISKIPNISIP